MPWVNLTFSIQTPQLTRNRPHSASTASVETECPQTLPNTPKQSRISSARNMETNVLQHAMVIQLVKARAETTTLAELRTQQESMSQPLPPPCLQPLFLLELLAELLVLCSLALEVLWPHKQVPPAQTPRRATHKLLLTLDAAMDSLRSSQVFSLDSLWLCKAISMIGDWC